MTTLPTPHPLKCLGAYKTHETRESINQYTHANTQRNYYFILRRNYYFKIRFISIYNSLVSITVSEDWWQSEHIFFFKTKMCFMKKGINGSNLFIYLRNGKNSSSLITECIRFMDSGSSLLNNIPVFFQN